ncbi:Hypothetical protein A7982_07254 [Minicystis rosea]|nr:Hypothetical protein A7982_07254 [Minicystis rosea]
MTCTRGEALIDVHILKGDDRVLAMLDRRLSRRSQRVADLGLADDLVEALRQRGGRILG